MGGWGERSGVWEAGRETGVKGSCQAFPPPGSQPVQRCDGTQNLRWRNTLSARTAYGIGVDLGGTTFTVGTFNAQGLLVDKAEAGTPVSCEPLVIVRAVTDLIRARLSAQELGTGDLAGVAVGFPGPVDPVAGVVKKAPNRPCLAGFPLASSMSQTLAPAPVWVHNDAYCATLAELRWGAGREAENLVMLTLGTGIGGGIALGNEVVRGPRQIMGELGHMILDPNGRRCGCGNYGCLEALAARDAIIELAERALQSGTETRLAELAERDPEGITPRGVAELAAAGDAAAVGVYERVGFYIGLALCNAIVACDPDLILLGGGISAAGDVLFEPVRRTVRARSLITGFDADNILPAAFQSDAGVYGAGALAWEQARQR
jgi:glucokinase